MKTIKIVTTKKVQDGTEYIELTGEQWLKTDTLFFDEKLITHTFLLSSLSRLLGKTLTVIDASVVDKQQNKAMKDMLRNIFSNEMNLTADRCFDQEKTCELANECVKEGTKIVPVSVEEVLGIKE